ncbi:MAG: hypothetical protein JXM70_19310 [Pirellulales bacterium]|nr:hypothetical protein [Pirellulales bacterium]
MKALILAAGKDDRLKPLIDEKPVVLFEIENKPLIFHMLDKLLPLNLEEVIILIGYKHQMIADAVKDNYKGLKIKYLINDKYDSTNVIYSLWLAKDYLQDGFISIDGDVLCEAGLYMDVAHSEFESVMVVDHESELGADEMKAKVVNDEIVAIGKELAVNSEAQYGESIGVNKFSGAFVSQYFGTVDSLINDGKTDLYYEDAIQMIINDHKIHRMNIKGYNWIEIDKLEEFEKANRLFSNIHELSDFVLSLPNFETKVISMQDLVFDSRVLLKCSECPKYGKTWTCPPFPDDFDVHALLSPYNRGLMVFLKSTFNTEDEYNSVRQSSTNTLHRVLLDLEKKAGMLGYYYATSFIGGSCKLCPNGCDEEKCRFPHLSRRPLEAVGIDVVETAKKCGVEIKFPVQKYGYFYRAGLLLLG